MLYSVCPHLHVLSQHCQRNVTYIRVLSSSCFTTGPRKSLFQRLICTQKYTISTSETVLIREGSISQFSGALIAICLFCPPTNKFVISFVFRRGFDALGDHYLDRGDYGYCTACCHCFFEVNPFHPFPHTCTYRQALKMFTRARDHCTSAKHVVSMCMNVMKVRFFVYYFVCFFLFFFSFVYFLVCLLVCTL